MSMGSVLVPQFASRKKVRDQGVSQKKTRPIPEDYKLLEEQGWSTETTLDIVVMAVGNCPGLKAGEIAKAAADIVGLSPEAREVKTPNGRDKYKADTYHRLEDMHKRGLAERDKRSRGRYVLTDSGREKYQGLPVAIPAAPLVVDLKPTQEPIQKPIKGVYLGEPIIIQADRDFDLVSGVTMTIHEAVEILKQDSRTKTKAWEIIPDISGVPGVVACDGRILKINDVIAIAEWHQANRLKSEK